MVDFTVRGAGIIGLMMAWTLIQRGFRVQVIDRYGAGAGASGGIVGALAPHMPEKWGPKKQFQFESLQLCEALWPEIDAVSGLSSGYGRVGRLQPLQNERGIALAHEREAGAQIHWGSYAQWTVVDQVPDWVPASPMVQWVYDTLSARINPAAAVASLVRALQIKGCLIYTEGDHKGTVIWATGVHDLARISQAFGQFYGAGEKGQGAILYINLGATPQLYSDNIHIIPHENGTTAVGSTTERYFDDPTTTDELLDDLLQRACDVVPALRGASVLTRWANQRPRSHTRAPILGHHPIETGAYIANGGFKIGLAMAPKMAQVLADYIIDGVDTIPQDFVPNFAK